MTSKLVVTLEEVEKGVQECSLPPQFAQKLRDYLVERNYPGKAVTFALLNDFVGLMGELANTPELLVHARGLAQFLVWNAPAVSWGSLEAVRDWLGADYATIEDPSDMIFLVTMNGRSLGLWTAPSEVHVLAMARGQALGLSREESLEVDPIELSESWLDFCDQHKANPDDLRVDFLYRLSSLVRPG